MMTSPAADRLCLVTGGAGFIGSHLVEHLVRLGEKVVVVDNFSTGDRHNLRQVDDAHVTVIESDLMDALPELDTFRFNAIYHLAAAVGVRLVIEHPIETIETNVLETTALLRFAAAQHVPTLIASTSEVYGKGSRTPFAEDDDVVYGSTQFSRWSYACSKAIDEYLALAYAREHNLPVLILRFFNTVGPRQVGEYGMVLPRFVEAALAGKPIEVHGDGQQSRCFCDVRDIVPALPRLLEIPDAAGNVFNIGRDQPITIQALAELVKETLASESPIVHIPYDRAFGKGFDDLRTRQPDLSRIRSAIGFEPSIPLEQTIADLANDLKSRSVSSAERSV